MRKTLVVAAALLSSACGMDPENLAMGDTLRLLDTAHSETEQAATVCAGGSTLFGIDVSYYQGTINWTSAKSDGVKYAIIRVSDGTTFEDPKFTSNWSGAHAAGVLRGAYQFFRPGQSINAQADLMIEKLNGVGAADLPPVIDVEATDGVADATIATRVGQWLDRVESATGLRPIIYTGKYFWQDNVGNSQAYDDYPLWHAQYTSAACPNIADAWADWAFWQYSSTGSVSGISGDVDMNRFNGGLAGLTDLGGAPDWAGQPMGQSFPVASAEPLEVCVGETVQGHIDVKNIGARTWDDTVKLAPTPRDDASPFAADSWLSETRVARANEDTAPGQTARFAFEVQGNMVGLFDQTFGLVAEGAAWFADAGGPADDYIELKVKVVDCRDPWGAELVGQSFPTGGLDTVAGAVIPLWFDMKNTGTETWRAGELVKLAPTPRDEASPLRATSWLSATRVAYVSADTAPGEVGRFSFDIVATGGDFDQTFGLVAEGTTWFAAQGGPADDILRVTGRARLPVMVQGEIDPRSAPKTNDDDDDGPDVGLGDKEAPGGGALGPSTVDGCSATDVPARGAPLGLAVVFITAAALRRRRPAP